MIWAARRQPTSTVFPPELRWPARDQLPAGLHGGTDYRRVGLRARAVGTADAHLNPLGVHLGVRHIRYAVGAHTRDELQRLGGGLPLLRRGHWTGLRQQVLAGLVGRVHQGAVEVIFLRVDDEATVAGRVGIARLAVRAHALRVGERLLVGRRPGQRGRTAAATAGCSQQRDRRHDDGQNNRSPQVTAVTGAVHKPILTWTDIAHHGPAPTLAVGLGLLPAAAGSRRAQGPPGPSRNGLRPRDDITGPRSPASQSPTSSSISVTSAAIWDRSERTRVTCANNGCPFSFSVTATTPSCRPTRRLSRCATSWVSTTRDPEPIRDRTVSKTPRSSDWASSTITNESCSERPRMWVSGSTSNMSRASTSSITAWEVTADKVS